MPNSPKCNQSVTELGDGGDFIALSSKIHQKTDTVFCFLRMEYSLLRAGLAGLCPAVPWVSSVRRCRSVRLQAVHFIPKQTFRVEALFFFFQIDISRLGDFMNKWMGKEGSFPALSRRDSKPLSLAGKYFIQWTSWLGKWIYGGRPLVWNYFVGLCSFHAWEVGGNISLPWEGRGVEGGNGEWRHNYPITPCGMGKRFAYWIGTMMCRWIKLSPVLNRMVSVGGEGGGNLESEKNAFSWKKKKRTWRSGSSWRAKVEQNRMPDRPK